jgi:cytochrome P450
MGQAAATAPRLEVVNIAQIARETGRQLGGTMIEIRRIADDDPFEFDVVVRQGKGTTLHHVTLSRELYERLIAGMHTPERLIEAAFRFLLDREPKESILRRFDVSVIARYFPEFERELPRYLAK